MKRLIYSMFIAIPEDTIQEEHVDCDITKQKTSETSSKMTENFEWLKSNHEEYAKKCGADYILYEYDKQYEDFKELYFKDRPWITTYNILNFYKIWLLHNEDYDEVVYLDIDVRPMSDDNILESLDFDTGILCRVNHEGEISTDDFDSHTIRSPRAKWWNARELLLDEGFDGENDVYNTGIVGANQEQLAKLAYFVDFDDKLDMMYEKATDDLYPEKIKSMLGYDNETLFSYLMQLNEVKLNKLDDDWHFIMNHKFSFIPKRAKLVHVINKDFDYVKNYIQRMV